MMDLIQALEQLSLEVRNQDVNQSNEIPMVTAHQYVQPVSSDKCSYKNEVWQYPNHRLRQLHEFDTSIETLFAQISDLDSKHKTQISTCARRAGFAKPANHYRPGFDRTGSMETSQEEDSDCSSQQSGQTNSSSSVCHANPLLRDLLKKDIGSITNTVRKISKILAVGNELENFYKQLVITRTKNHESLPEQAPDDFGVNISYGKSLCDTYISLCADEPHIEDLPTILQFSECCHKLILELNKLSSGNVASSNMETISIVMSEGYEGEEVIGEDEAAFLDLDKRRVDNWTENKLYKNHQ